MSFYDFCVCEHVCAPVNTHANHVPAHHTNIPHTLMQAKENNEIIMNVIFQNIIDFDI